MRAIRQYRIELREPVHKVVLLLLAALVGASTGFIAIIAYQLPFKWLMVILLAVAAPVVVLLVKDIRTLILIAFTIDIPLGLDIAIKNQPEHTGGPSGYLISLMTVALIVGYAVWIVEKKPKPQFFATTTIPALLYLLMVVVSLFQSVDIQFSLFGVFLLCQLWLMYFYLANHIRSRMDLRIVLMTAVVGLLFQASIMLLQYFTGASLSFGAISSSSFGAGASAGVTGIRPGGTIGTPNSAAAYLVFSILLSFSAYLSEKFVNRILALAACALGLVALIATSSRSAWASLVLAVLILLSQVIWTKTGIRAFLILLIGTLFTGILFGRQIIVRLEAVREDRSRPELAYMAHNIIDAFPMGVGENNYGQIMSDRYAHPNWVGHTLMVVHNKYLLVWAETGIQGLMAFVLLLLATAWQTRRWLFRTNLPPDLLIPAAGILGAFLGYAVHMFMEGFSSRANLQILWFLIAMSMAMDQLIFQSRQKVKQGNPITITGLES